MTADTYPDAWQDLCLVGIIPDATSPAELAFGTYTEDITGMDWGEKDVEGKPLTSGGRVVTFTAMTDESITMKMWPTTVDLAGGTAQLFHQQTADDTINPVTALNTTKRRKYGLIFLWAKTLPATAGALPAANVAAYRIEVVNAYCTSYKPSYDDKNFSAEVTFKWAPFNKAGTPNKREQSTITTALLAAITTATTMPTAV